MRLKDVAVFGTRHIQTGHPLFAGQKPAHEEYVRGERLAWYSTGKLEEALARGMTVYVCSIRPAFGPHDDWWRKLVGDARIFRATRVLFADDPYEASFEPWREVYALLGVSWPEGRFKDFDDPATWISSGHGVALGDDFVGFTAASGVLH